MNRSYIPCRNSMKFDSFAAKDFITYSICLWDWSLNQKNFPQLSCSLSNGLDGILGVSLLMIDPWGKCETLSKWWWQWQWCECFLREELKLLSAHVGTCSWTIYMFSCQFCFFMFQVPFDLSSPPALSLSGIQQNNTKGLYLIMQTWGKTALERLGSFISSLGLYGRGTSMPLLYPMYGIAEVQRSGNTRGVLEGFKMFKVVNLVPTIFMPWHGKLLSVFPKLRNLVLVPVVHQDVFIYIIVYILVYVLAIHDMILICCDHPPTFYFVFFIRR